MNLYLFFNLDIEHVHKTKNFRSKINDDLEMSEWFVWQHSVYWSAIFSLKVVVLVKLSKYVKDL